MSLKVLTDYHHDSLFNSLVLLFELRLKGEIKRPIGMEWFREGYWAVNDQEDTAQQFLQVNSIPADGTPPLNNANSLNHVISFEDFKNTKFDILIASIPAHIEPFKKLIQLYQPQAKLIYQIGNQWNVDSSQVKNVMASAKVNIPSGVNGVIYHQEFDLKIFYQTPVALDKKIYSFVNCLNTADLFKPDWYLFTAVARFLPDWEFKSFGGQCVDGNIDGQQALADKMREATFIFHCKSQGDGYGHIIHNAAAVGRPLITRYSDYKGKLAEPFMWWDKAINVENQAPGEVAQQIYRVYNELKQTRAMGEHIYQTFKEVVNFDKEEAKIREFLDHLQ